MPSRKLSCKGQPRPHSRVTYRLSHIGEDSQHANTTNVGCNDCQDPGMISCSLLHRQVELKRNGIAEYKLWSAVEKPRVQMQRKNQS